MLANDLMANGLIQPVIVRRLSNSDSYEILSGHSRTAATELAGLSEIEVIVCDADDNKASRIVTTSNFSQRQKILPSEKARAFKLRNDELKKLREFPDEQALNPQNSDIRIAHSHGGNEEIFKELEREFGESKSTIFRYLRLNNLIEEFLLLADGGKLKLEIACEVSYLKHSMQQVVYQYFILKKHQGMSAKLLRVVREDDEKRDITEEYLDDLINQQQGVKKKMGALTISSSSLSKYAAHFKNVADLQQTIIKLLDDYIQSK